ncbi:S9 family peptidase [Dyella solisilvae]|uniref:S9 family peptidase n=1 Tax=Dyella solisilvae TaxID=1920168 RepID=A0A370KCT2_9GAMM|nr:S9 family peptidase [Dyella solisilvae]RDJ00466.1 S9 family peptidase [Dyella solisilvae]
MTRRRSAAIALALLCIAPAVAAAVESATIATRDFIRPSEFTDVLLSPDGRYISALAPRPNTPYENMLAVIDTTTGKPVSSIRAGSRNEILEYRWVNDHRLVLAFATRVGSLATPSPTGELMAFDADGNHGIYLFGARGNVSADSNHMQQGGLRRDAYAKLLSSAPFGDERFLLVQTQPFTDHREGSVPSIERLDVASGESRRVLEGPAPDVSMTLDHTGEVRAAYSDGLLWTREAHGKWTLSNNPNASHVGISPIGFNHDNTRLYVEVTHPEGPDSIELMDLQSSERTLLYRGEFADPGELLPAADGSDFYGVITGDGVQAVHFFDLHGIEAQITDALAASFPGQLIRLTSFTRDGRLAIVDVSSDRNPGDYYLFDLDKSQARYLFSERRWLPTKRMRPMQPIALNARDGVQLHGFLTEPEGKGPFPMVVLPHGGPHGLFDQWMFDEETQLLASRGYAVLQINYRGSGGYGAHFENMGYRQWGLAMQDDITDATRWAIREGHADSARVCIYGGSYGGYAALEGAVREPDLYRCAIGYAGVYDLRLQLTKSDTQRTDSGLDYLHEAMGDDTADLLRRSPIAGADQIKANLLLIHGYLDERAPYAHFKALTNALDKQRKHYESLVESSEGHGFFLLDHQLAMYDKLLDFLARNIGPSSAATGDTTATSRTLPANP